MTARESSQQETLAFLSGQLTGILRGWCRGCLLFFVLLVPLKPLKAGVALDHYLLHPLVKLVLDAFRHEAQAGPVTHLADRTGNRTPPTNVCVCASMYVCVCEYI